MLESPLSDSMPAGMSCGMCRHVTTPVAGDETARWLMSRRRGACRSLAAYIVMYGPSFSMYTFAHHARTGSSTNCITVGRLRSPVPTPSSRSLTGCARRRGARRRRARPSTRAARSDRRPVPSAVSVDGFVAITHRTQSARSLAACSSRSVIVVTRLRPSLIVTRRSNE